MKCMDYSDSFSFIHMHVKPVRFSHTTMSFLILMGALLMLLIHYQEIDFLALFKLV